MLTYLLADFPLLHINSFPSSSDSVTLFINELQICFPNAYIIPSLANISLLFVLACSINSLSHISFESAYAPNPFSDN